MKLTAIVLLALTLMQPALGQQDETPDSPDNTTDAMTVDRLGELVRRIDEDAVQDGAAWVFEIVGLETILVHDAQADRMRIMIPVNNADDLPPEELLRLMQANFDSALDARYAVANDILWGVFIHPLSSLTEEEFFLGVGQTANIVVSFGQGYSSGMFIFGGGDSGEIERKRLLEELRSLQEEST